MTQLLARLDALPPEWRGAVAAIGNFDGVHVGHQAVLGRALDEARALSVPCLALTFEPHPRTWFAPASPVFRLTPAPLKAALVRALGLDGTVVMTFDGSLAGMPAEAFVADVLVGRLGLAHVVAGFDFHFGHRRLGTPALLQEAGRASGFGVTIVEEHGDEGGAVSSTRIRDALSEGGIGLANRLLGWIWGPSGAVVHGDKRGRKLGYPTANMALPPETRLAHGVYAVRLQAEDGEVRAGVASFGRRPTFGDGRPLFETYLFDFSGDLYGRHARLELVEYLRGEEKFASAEALIAQMDRDAVEARAAFAARPPQALDTAVASVWGRALRDAGDAGLL